MRRALLVLFLAWPAAADPLAIVDLTVRRSEEGMPLDQPVFRTGEMVYMNFRVTGFKVEGDDQDVALAYTIETADPSGRKIAEPKRGEVKVQLAQEDKHWAPKIRYEVQLPPVPEPGVYTATITIEDQLGKTGTRGTKTFTIDAPKLPDSTRLAATNFRFQRSETASAGIPDGEPFHPGETVWARFDVGGYQFGPKNRYEIRYSLALENSEGKVMFEQADAAVESNEGFYPKHYTSGLFSFSLDRTIAPGSYTLVIGLKDTVGNQTAQSEHPFTIAR